MYIYEGKPKYDTKYEAIWYSERPSNAGYYWFYGQIMDNREASFRDYEEIDLHLVRIGTDSEIYFDGSMFFGEGWFKGVWTPVHMPTTGLK